MSQNTKRASAMLLSAKRVFNENRVFRARPAHGSNTGRPQTIRRPDDTARGRATRARRERRGNWSRSFVDTTLLFRVVPVHRRLGICRIVECRKQSDKSKIKKFKHLKKLLLRHRVVATVSAREGRIEAETSDVPVDRRTSGREQPADRWPTRTAARWPTRTAKARLSRRSGRGRRGTTRRVSSSTTTTRDGGWPSGSDRRSWRTSATGWPPCSRGPSRWASGCWRTGTWPRPRWRSPTPRCWRTGRARSRQPCAACTRRTFTGCSSGAWPPWATATCSSSARQPGRRAAGRRPTTTTTVNPRRPTTTAPSSCTTTLTTTVLGDDTVMAVEKRRWRHLTRWWKSAWSRKALFCTCCCCSRISTKKKKKIVCPCLARKTCFARIL